MDTRTRTLAKSFSWRAFSSTISALIVLAITHQIELSLIVGGIDFVIKILAYYIHERLWGRIKWGQK